MTCEHCALSVQAVLEDAGATGVFVDHRRGFAELDPEGLDLERARELGQAAGYELGEPLPIGGDGAAAFAGAIQAVERGARVVMVEQGTVGGTCVNVGCVPSKAMLRAGELYNVAGHNPHHGTSTWAGPVALGELVAQKDALVERMRREKYCDLIEEYGWELVEGHAEFADAKTLLVDGRPL